MKNLPVPPLSQTLPRWERAVSAVVDQQTLARTQERIRDFAEGAGPQIQAELEAFAQTEGADGRSWLSEEWLEGYLTVREPLPLSTNVGFQLTGDFGAPGPDRATEFLARAAAVHLDQARGQTPPEVDGRGNTMDPDQWTCLNGGIRHPRPEKDQILRSTRDASDREVGVFHRGRLFAVQVSDAAGNPLPLPALRAALGTILEAAPAAPDQEFAAPSHLGSAALAPLLEEMLQEEANAAAYQRLCDFLFTLTLVPEPGEEAEHLRGLTFAPGHVWAYKPISYEIGLADLWLCLHAEHSTVDGATLLAAVGRIQEAQIPQTTGLQPSASQGNGDGPAPQAPAPEELRWHCSAAVQERLRTGLAEVTERALHYEVRTVLVPGLPAEPPLKVSGDAAMQLIMTTAQILAHGRPRSAYEAVDMREYQAGRTECLRPVTPEAVACAQALADGSAEQALRLLPDALEAHRGWVKACKAGQGADRHLLGLARAAERIGVEHPLFTDEGTVAAGANFLSTTSIGGADRIVRYAFAPTRPEGFGISYTPRPEGFEFCVCWDRERAERPEEFLEALGRAGAALREALER